MDKPLLPINKPGNILHNISVMFFLFFSESQTFITPVTEKNISDMAFSPYDFSQKIQISVFKLRTSVFGLPSALSILFYKFRADFPFQLLDL